MPHNKGTGGNWTVSFKAKDNRADELQEKVDSAVHDLIESLKAGHTEAFFELLDFARRFYRYSWGNQMLIMRQAPHARHVASFKKWLEMGFPVKKGAKAIWIWAPYTFKEKDKKTGELTGRTGLGFKPVPVFDDSQVENQDKLPTLFKPIGNNNQELLDYIIKSMEDDGIKIVRVDEMSAEGWARIDMTVAVKNKDTDGMIATLIHEWTHILVHLRNKDESWTKEQRECHAESSAYIVCHALGIEVPYTSDYLLSYKAGVDVVTKELDVIQKVVKTILDKLLSSNIPSVNKAA